MTALMHATEGDDVQEVRWLLETGGANTLLAGENGNTALMHALPGSDTMRYLLEEGSSNIDQTNKNGDSLLLLATSDVLEQFCGPEIIQCILEHGADISLRNNRGDTIWDILLLELDNVDLTRPTAWTAVAARTALLRVMVLQETPPDNFLRKLEREHANIAHEGALIRVLLPEYLARRRALLDHNCPLIAPLQALVCAYEKPTTPEEVWATVSAHTFELWAGFPHEKYK
jgi:hypothetical protein